MIATKPEVGIVVGTDCEGMVATLPLGRPPHRRADVLGLVCR
jgi:hypothetical protein